MDETLQLVAVIAIVAVAGAYTVRSFLRQFHRAEDEAPGCAACPAAELDRRGGAHRGAAPPNAAESRSPLDDG